LVGGCDGFLRLHDLEIVCDSGGKPVLRLSERFASKVRNGDWPLISAAAMSADDAPFICPVFISGCAVCAEAVDPNTIATSKLGNRERSLLGVCRIKVPLVYVSFS